MRLSPLFALLLVSACAMPAAPPALAPRAPATLGLVDAPLPPIAADWWRDFGDPQLDRLVADALAGSPSLDVALARVRQAEAVLSTRRAEDEPSLGLDASLQAARLSGRYTIPPPFGGTVRTIGTAQANLSWTLDLFGRQRLAIEGARASVRAAAYDVAAARLSLAGAVVQAYAELARAERLAGIAGETIAARERGLRLVGVRVRNRLASQLDVQAQTTLLAQARQALVRAQGARALAVDALAALAGRGPDYAAAIGSARLRLDAPTPVPAALPAELLARRPDVLAAQARIAAAAAGREVARRAYLPNVNLAAFAGLQAIGLGNLLSLDAGTAGVGPAVSLPIFDGGRRRAELAGSAAALDLATADYNDRLVTAVREAADAVARLAANRAEAARAAEVSRGFAETGRLNAIRVSSGLESRLGLVDTDIRLLEARQIEAGLAADAVAARAQLILALGGGFQDTQP